MNEIPESVAVESLKREIDKMAARLQRTAARSGRRKTAFKHLQKAYEAQGAALKSIGRYQVELHKEVLQLREEKATAWKAECQKARNYVNSMPLWWRILGRV